jgi:hypothetical protein
VPGYYVRRNLDGQIENSTCMNNTASEHYMFSRFIVDDLLHWATQYKVRTKRRVDVAHGVKVVLASRYPGELIFSI